MDENGKKQIQLHLQLLSAPFLHNLSLNQLCHSCSQHFSQLNPGLISINLGFWNNPLTLFPHFHISLAKQICSKFLFFKAPFSCTTSLPKTAVVFPRVTGNINTKLNTENTEVGSLSLSQDEPYLCYFIKRFNLIMLICSTFPRDFTHTLIHAHQHHQKSLLQDILLSFIFLDHCRP